MGTKKASKAADPKPNGRPTKYRPEFCQMLIEHMSGGPSYESFAAKVPCDRSILFDWEKAHTEWAEAKSIAFAANLLFWEQLGIKHILNESESFGEGQSKSTSLNGAVWIFNMKNRHKWRDKQPDEGADVNINVNLADRMAKARARVGKADK